MKTFYISTNLNCFVAFLTLSLVRAMGASTKDLFEKIFLFLYRDMHIVIISRFIGYYDITS